MKIYAPNKYATGTWCSTQFVNGVGETDDPLLIKWFVDHGYKVETTTKDEKPQPIVEETTTIEVVKSDEPDLESMTPNELREWLKANGFGSQIKNIRDKEKLLNIARG